ncbi:MAG: alpha/beta fold hydrolase [Aquabacterium sp.]|uniref:alpha/beta fold hydrolase n=1 Tax=Aquabacterium sp. TaxID=1872578 RepID=UPI003BC7441E
MQLIQWTHTAREGFTLRGWHTPPSGKPLLHFMHGNGFCGRTYTPMLQHLSHEFDLWLFDAQGHGDSDHGGPFVGWNRNAELAMEALHQQGKAFAKVDHYALGHSFGGVLTSLVLGQHARQFKRAVLLDPVLFSPAMILGVTLATLTNTARLSPLARSARARRHHWTSREEAFEQLRHRGVYKTWTTEALHAFVQHALKPADDGGVELKCRPSREAEIFSSAPEQLWGHLGRISTPTHLIHGNDTFPFVLEGAARLRKVNRHVSTEEVVGTHCFMQETPADTAQRVRQFLLSA